jgi:pimeloyl-ACP methyl ester carboxylesterase
MLTDKTFDMGTRKVHYVEGPASGPPLIFVHGAAWDWRVFLPVLPKKPF